MPQFIFDYCTVQAAAAANLSAGIYKYQNFRFAAAPLVIFDLLLPNGHHLKLRLTMVQLSHQMLHAPPLRIVYSWISMYQPMLRGKKLAFAIDLWTDEAELYADHYNWTGPLVITHELHEKSSNVKSGINSTVDVADKIRMHFPGITDTIVNKILALYPESDYTSPGLRFSDIEQSFELTSHNLALTNGLHNQTWNAMVALGEATHGTDQDYYWYSTYALSGDIQTNPVNATTARITQKYLLSFALTGNPNTLWPNDKMEWPLYNTSNNGMKIVFNTSIYLQADSSANAKSRFWNRALWY